MATLAAGGAVKGLEAKARRMAAQSVERAKEHLSAKIDVPGVSARITSRGVELSGRALGRRLLTDPRLRWIGGLFR